MNMKRKLKNAILSITLCVALILQIPLSAMNISAAPESDSYARTADLNTLDEWKQYFGAQSNHPQDLLLSTEFAGAVWTDKSVFEPGNVPTELTRAKYNNNTFTLSDKGDNFLVSLSAIASNKQITGYSTIPTDTVFVLDMSSSMRSNDDNGRSAIDELVDATNSAIQDLLALNKNNRIAVVLYAGNVNASFSSAQGTTQVLMPLDTYSARTNGRYLEATSLSGNENWAIRVASGVTGSNGTVSGNKATATGTFIQDGIYEAMRVFLSADPTVNSGIQAGTDRLPIMVLMTDGEPTLANNDYDGNNTKTDLGNSTMYNFEGSTGTYSHRDTIAFMTMLTAAYAKKEIASHYGDALFYTLAYGEEVTRLDEALSVMDPGRSSRTLNTMWNAFLNDQAVTVYRIGSGRNVTYYTTKNATSGNARLVAEDKLYVDEYFPAETDNDFAEAFDAIVDEIIIQSKYYPTYVENDHDHDGYLTFVDKIGKYMQVSDIKGIVVGDRLFSGAALASSLGDSNDALGTVENPTNLGDNFIWSVKERLGIADTLVAQNLVTDAYNHKQLYYENSQNFSHYIGWFSDPQGNYIDFWHEDMTEAQLEAAMYKGATHIMKSYGFLGDTSILGGVSNTDMMYMTVRIATEIASGDSILTWQLPASLIPTVTYEVSVNVDEDGNILEVTELQLEDGTAEDPIRLLYEVELQDGIYDWNLTQKVPYSYKDSTENKDAGYVFYTNKWTSNEEDTTLNTYSHFEPSEDNERYYYIEDSIVYADDQGTVYTGERPTSGTYYRQFSVYEKLGNGQVRSHIHYEPITATSLALAEENDANQWVIPKDTVHRYYDFENTHKANNLTGTMDYTDHPFIVAGNDHYYTYSTQGNNGKLNATPATGIKLTKILTDAETGATGTFTFTIQGDIANASVVRLDASGNEASRTALPANGEVTLTAGETVYVVGLTAGSYTITENAHNDYIVNSVIVDGTAAERVANVTVTAENINDVQFVNAPKSYGNVIITKEVSHAIPGHVVPAAMLDQEFKVNVSVGTALAGTLDTLVAGQPGNVTTDSEGNFEVTIKHGQRFELLNLPDGTIVTVTEDTTGLPAYYQYAGIATRDHSGAVQDTDNQVQIYSGENATAVVHNTYNPVETDPVNISFNITKDFQADGWTGNADFTFKLQEWIIPNGETQPRWVDMDQATLSFTQEGQQQITLPNGMGGIQYNEAREYAYQVMEYLPQETERVPGITYDRTLYTFTVKVTDNNGKLVAVINDAQGNAITDNMNVTFTNTYHTAPLSIDINKKVEDTSENAETTKAGFAFNVVEELYDSATDTWSATGVTASVYSDAAGEARFVKTFEKMDGGTYPVYYRYSVSEQAGNKPNWTYASNTEYVYFVVDLDSNEELVVTATDENRNVIAEASVPTFTNIYDPGDATINLNNAVAKNLIGRDYLNANEFTFAVFRDGEASHTDTTNALLVGTNDETGKVTFNNDGNLTFAQIGTYKFDIVEIDGNLGGVSYTNRIYDLVVEVTDAGDGTLVANYYFEDSTTGQVTFYNRYSANPVTNAISGTKNLDGRPMLNAEFAFRMTEVADEAGTALPNALVWEAENGPATNNEATFTFEEITYNSVGTHYYKVEEIPDASKLGVTFATNYYIVKVDITDNGSGNLVATESIVYSSDNSTEILFNNYYKPGKGVTALYAVKQLDGRNLNADEFEFTINETESDFETLVNGGLNETVTNTSVGTIDFSEIEFEEPETRYFVIKEVVGYFSGVTYDAAEYHVTVSAVDDHKGVLVTTTVIEKQTTELDDIGIEQIVTIPVSSIVFANKYTQPYNPPEDDPQPTPRPTEVPPVSPLTGDTSGSNLLFVPLLICAGAFALITLAERKRRSDK